MTNDALSVVSLLFSTIWSLFTSWTIPGTNTTPGEFSLFILVVVLIIRTVKRLFDNGEER